MAADRGRTGGGLLLTRRTSYGGRESASAARRIEAERWLADHAAELAEPVIDAPGIMYRPPEDAEDAEDAEDRIHADALADIAERASAAAEAHADPAYDPWGDTFDPEDLQWGFTTHRSPHTLPGATSGRPQPSHLAC